VSTRESRPKAAHEVPAKGPTDSLTDGPDFTAEDRHAAFVAGYEQGKAERIEAEIKDRARAMLVEWSNESRNMATEYASKVGPNWAALIAECGDRE